MARCYDKVRIGERWAGFFYKLLNTKNDEARSHRSRFIPPRPLALPFGDQPTMSEMTETFRGLPKWNVVKPGCLPAKLMKLDHPEFVRCFQNILVNVWRTGECNGMMRPSTPFQKEGSL